jgi:hypothetical protein
MTLFLGYELCMLFDRTVKCLTENVYYTVLPDILYEIIAKNKIHIPPVYGRFYRSFLLNRIFKVPFH